MHSRRACSARCSAQCVAVCCSVSQCVAVCCSVLQCVAVCCSVLQCVAVCCSAWHCDLGGTSASRVKRDLGGTNAFLVPHCNRWNLLHLRVSVSAHCNRGLHTATGVCTLQQQTHSPLGVTSASLSSSLSLIFPLSHLPSPSSSLSLIFHLSPDTKKSLPKNMRLFCRISSLLQGSFAKETHNFIDSTTQFDLPP
jgi:hypothetical protein